MFSVFNFILNLINLCLLISLLKTSDSNMDLLLDIERKLRRYFRFRMYSISLPKKGKK